MNNIDELVKSPSHTSASVYQIQTKREHVNVRSRILKLQNSRCTICDTGLNASGGGKQGACLDHQHKRRRSDPNGERGNGLIRGVLCSACNCLEGKIWNVNQRHGRDRERLPQLLRRLAVYYEEGWYPFVHLNEKPKAPKVSKQQFNRLIKAMKQHNEQQQKQQKLPCFPKTKNRKITKYLRECFEKFNISPYSRSTRAPTNDANKTKDNGTSDRPDPPQVPKRTKFESSSRKTKASSAKSRAAVHALSRQDEPE